MRTLPQTNPAKGPGKVTVQSEGAGAVWCAMLVCGRASIKVSGRM